MTKKKEKPKKTRGTSNYINFKYELKKYQCPYYFRKQIDQNPTSEEAASNDSNKPDTKERKKGKTRGRGRGRGNHVMHTNPYHTHTLSHMAFSQSMQSLNPNISPWMRQPVQVQSINIEGEKEKEEKDVL